MLRLFSRAVNKYKEFLDRAPDLTLGLTVGVFGWSYLLLQMWQQRDMGYYLGRYREVYTVIRDEDVHDRSLVDENIYN